MPSSHHRARGCAAIAAACCALLVAGQGNAAVQPPAQQQQQQQQQRGRQQQHNVVMLVVDDLRHAGAAFGQPEVLMPHLDALAARATVFTNAYAQAATCGVSRASLLTSRRPDTTQVLSNSQCPFTTKPEHAAWVSLPQYFALHGYSTHGFGKIFHPDVCDGAAVGEQRAAWTDQPYYHAPCISLGSIYNHTCYEKWPGPLPEGPGGKVTSVFANNTPGSAADMPDGMIAAAAEAKLRELAARQRQADASGGAIQPFFAAIGFHKPHLPHIAPQEFFDLYPLENVSLPSNASRHTPQGIVDGAWNNCNEFQSYKDVAKFAQDQHFSEKQPLNDDTTRRQRQAYFASASFADAQLGRVLQVLEDTGLDDNTVVALWGDHGWHVGENNEWAKHTAMNWANRAPLLFALPGRSAASSSSAAAARVEVSQGFAEFVDVYPTLADLAGLPVPRPCSTADLSLRASNCTEGASLGAFVRGELGSAPTGKPAAFGQWPKSLDGAAKMGYNLYTTVPAALDPARSQVRYTEWVDYNHTAGGPVWQANITGIVELYNLTADPDENVNTATDPALADVVAALSAQLHAGWRPQAAQWAV